VTRAGRRRFRLDLLVLFVLFLVSLFESAVLAANVVKGGAETWELSLWSATVLVCLVAVRYVLRRIMARLEEGYYWRHDG
jgi:hypothetical protein